MNASNGQAIVAFPPVTKPIAIEIALQHRNMDVCWKCTNQKPSAMYLPFELKEPCWFVWMPYDRNWNVLRDSYVVIVSRVTGMVLGEGTAGDEG